ncbi:hypothetical protein LTS18_007099 [Coniosporium uncinatum]|uniref:Uncharacterized protein n=1 Tax=Coniosporium uncinatum TaxID=93489 RepID=A0ACC3D2X3_9PEZI|nr:hypothetical protein LTS18_007099 [Coniosporium uncinatum]
MQLSQLVRLPPNTPDGEVKFLANSIVISPRTADHHILQKVGGIGKIVRWKVVGIAAFENRVWAAKVEPIPANERIWTETSTPMVTLAHRRGARPMDASRIQNWQPVADADAIEFDTTVNEKVLLKIEEERRERNPTPGYQNGNRGPKRLHPRQDEGDDYISLGGEENQPPQGYGRPQNSGFQSRRINESRGGGSQGISVNHNRSRRHDGRGGQGQGHRGGGRGGDGGRGRGSFRGGGGGGGRGRGRGGGNQSSYRSLDDMGGGGYQGSGGGGFGGDGAYDY